MIGFFAFVVATIVFYVKPLCDNCHAEVRNYSDNIGEYDRRKIYAAISSIYSNLDFFSFQALLQDKLVFLVFFIGAMICLLCSTLFHTMSCHSEFVSNVFSRLDYAGISVLICGSSITWLYFGFYCEFYHRLTYMITIAVLGLLTIVLTLMDKFNRPVSVYDSGPPSVILVL